MKNRKIIMSARQIGKSARRAVHEELQRLAQHEEMNDVHVVGKDKSLEEDMLDEMLKYAESKQSKGKTELLIGSHEYIKSVQKIIDDDIESRRIKFKINESFIKPTFNPTSPKLGKGGRARNRSNFNRKRK